MTKQPRTVLATKVAELHAQGLNGVQIAKQLGIGRSYAYELITDPAGAEVKARKDSYRGECEYCGAPTSGSNGRARAPKVCVTCLTWTKDAVLDAFRDWLDEYGSTPRCADAIKSGRLPTEGTVRSLFGSWNAGLLAAGLGLNMDRRPETQEAIERALRLGEPTILIAERFGVTREAIHQRCKVRGTTITAIRRAAA
jgi:hypothetical protein